MRGYGMDYNGRGNGWMGGMDRGYDSGYGAGGQSGRNGGYNGSWAEGEWTGYGAGNQRMGHGGEHDHYSRRDFMNNQGGYSNDLGGRGYGRDYGTMDRGMTDRGYDHDLHGRHNHHEPRFFRHWADTDQDEDYAWESGRHGVPGGMSRGGYPGRGETDHGGGRWLDENGYPRGYQGGGVHNFARTGRDYFRAYGANFRNRYDPRW